MNAPQAVPFVIGQLVHGGFFAGSININGEAFGIAVAPKELGEFAGREWHESYDHIEGAQSYSNGLSNTNAMADAGSKLAIEVRALTIGGFNDWHLPALDQLEIMYRNLKPTTRKNSQWGRSGININALPPTTPYIAVFPVQTSALDFKAGEAEAFEDDYYWSSTQRAAHSDYAWYQDLFYGDQHGNHKSAELRARAVRIFPLSNSTI